MLYRVIPAELLQTEIDTCWVNVAGEDPAAYVRKYKGRAPVVHLKDFYLSNRDSKSDAPFYELIGLTRRPAGRMCLNSGRWDMECRTSEILKASEDAGAQWVVVEQDRPSWKKIQWNVPG